MNNSLLVTSLTGVMIAVAFYGCSSDDEDDTNEGSGGNASYGGSMGTKASGGANNSSLAKPPQTTTWTTANGGSSIGGSSSTPTTATGGSSIGGSSSTPTTATGGSSAPTSPVTSANGGSSTLGGSGGTSSSTEGAATTVVTSAGTAGAATGGTSAAAGQPTTGGTTSAAAGTSSAAGGTVASGGTSSAAGGTVVSGGTTSAAGGTVATGGTTSAAGGTTGASCSSLCSGSLCSPACLPQAFAAQTSEPIALCVPATSIDANTVICTRGTCADGAVGCALTATLGETTWAYGPTNARQTDVTATLALTRLDGTIDAAAGGVNCDFTFSPRNGRLDITAQGTVQPLTSDPALLGVTVETVNAPLSGLNINSSNWLCGIAATAAISSASTTFNEALADALRAYTNRLRCLECNDDCDRNIACVTAL